MITDIAETIRSLCSLMEEETQLLGSVGASDELKCLAAAKLRLTAALETQVAAIERESQDWLQAASAEPDFADALGQLREVAEINARTLARHIDLSRDLLDAVATDARRLAGSRQETYGAAGHISRVDEPVPVSINTRL